jgi:hypothetical protein
MQDSLAFMMQSLQLFHTRTCYIDANFFKFF